MPNSVTLDVDLVKPTRGGKRKVEMSPDGGNANAKIHDKVKFKKKDVGKGFRYRLIFRNELVPAGPHWPFAEAHAPNEDDRSDWQSGNCDFTAAREGDFKYTVEAEDGRDPVDALDPIIIIRA